MPLTLTSVYAHTYIRLEHRGKKRTNGRMMARANTSDAQPRCLLTLLTYGNVTQRQLLYKCFPITHACMLHAIVPAAESANSPFDLTYIRLKNAKKCTLLLDICNSSLSSSEPKAANSVNFFSPPPPILFFFFRSTPRQPVFLTLHTPRGSERIKTEADHYTRGGRASGTSNFKRKQTHFSRTNSAARFLPFFFGVLIRP